MHLGWVWGLWWQLEADGRKPTKTYQLLTVPDQVPHQYHFLTHHGTHTVVLTWPTQACTKG